MTEPLGRIFDISKGCVDDGPGLRTVVFLKGCHLGCPWCHNPEGRSRDPVIGYDLNRCLRCGRCESVCSRDWSMADPTSWREDCQVAGACVQVCPSGARRLVGRDVTVTGLVDDLLVDADFFRGTGGGVTFSGGEPLAQSGFLFACADRLRSSGVHVAVETAGFWPSRLVAPLMAAADLILFDLKHVDLEKLRTLPGKNCQSITDNLKALLCGTVPLELRITLIPTFNSASADITSVARWLLDCARVPPVRLQPFHRLASHKASLYGIRYAFADAEPTSDAELSAASRLLATYGIPLASD